MSNEVLTNNRPLSHKAFDSAKGVIAGGVNSPVRALRAVGETPLFVNHAEGAEFTDIDGNKYIDFCLSWGVFIVGHAHPEVRGAAIGAINAGSSYGIPTLVETELAERVRSLIPSMELVRFVNSGTEAVMSAIRVARGFTGRDYIVKFDGCYHGHADHLLVAAGSGVATFGQRSSAGVPEDFAKHTLVAPFNDKAAVQSLFEKYADKIAAVIVEPVPANMGVVPERDDFLHFLREETRTHGSLLIFDEVITGFRLTSGGAQKLYGISPDLTTVGKIVGGGFPAAAFGGRREIMSLLAPEGPVYQAGTLSGNPVAMNAGLATLGILSGDGVYEGLNAKAERFITRFAEALRPHGVAVNHVGSMFTPFFTGGAHPANFADVNAGDKEAFARFWRYMLSRGVYLSPSQFESNFVSLAHTEEQLERVISIVNDYKS